MRQSLQALQDKLQVLEKDHNPDSKFRKKLSRNMEDKLQRKNKAMERSSLPCILQYHGKQVHKRQKQLKEEEGSASKDNK